MISFDEFVKDTTQHSGTTPAPISRHASIDPRRQSMYRRKKQSTAPRRLADSDREPSRKPASTLTAAERAHATRAFQTYRGRSKDLSDMLLYLNLCRPVDLDLSQFGISPSDECLTIEQFLGIVEQLWLKLKAECSIEAIVADAYEAAHPVVPPANTHHSVAEGAGVDAGGLHISPTGSPRFRDDSLLREVVEPMHDVPFDRFREFLLHNDEADPVFVKAFRRIGAKPDDMGKHRLDNGQLRQRCSDIGLSEGETQAVVNIFDDDVSGEISFSEFKRVVQSDWSTLGVSDDIAACVGKLLDLTTSRRMALTAIESMSPNARSKSLFSKAFQATATGGALHAAGGGSSDGEDLLRSELDLDATIAQCHDDLSDMVVTAEQIKALDARAARSCDHRRVVTAADLRVPLVHQAAPPASSYSGRRHQRKLHFDMSMHKQRSATMFPHLSLPPSTAESVTRSPRVQTSRTAPSGYLPVIQPTKTAAPAPPASVIREQVVSSVRQQLELIRPKRRGGPRADQPPPPLATDSHAHQQQQ